MNESDQVAGGTWPRCAVDELDPSGLESSQFVFEIVNAVRDVVHSLPTPRDKAAHGRIGTQGLEEFDSAHEGHSNALVLEGFGLGTTLTR